MKHRRTAALLVHGALAAVIAGWGVWGAYTFWSWIFGTPIAAVGALLLIEAFTAAAFALHIIGIPTPVSKARHGLPFVSAFPALHSIHALASPIGDAWAWGVAAVLTMALTAAAYAVWRGIELLLTNDAVVLDAEIARRREATELVVRRIASEAEGALHIVQVMKASLRRFDDLDRPALLARQATFPAPVYCERTDAASNIANERTDAASNIANERTDAASNIANERTDAASNIANERTDAASNIANERTDDADGWATWNENDNGGVDEDRKRRRIQRLADLIRIRAGRTRESLRNEGFKFTNAEYSAALKLTQRNGGGDA